MIWTTTPWTIPHNRALAFHPDFEYVMVQTETGSCCSRRIASQHFRRTATSSKPSELARFKGQEFEGMKFQHPFLPIQVPGVLAEYVTLDQGSGIVHTAPGHGADDFVTGQKYGLEVYAPIDDRGVYLEGLPEYKGKDVFAANPIVVEAVGRSRGVAGEP